MRNGGLELHCFGNEFLGHRMCSEDRTSLIATIRLISNKQARLYG